MDSQLDDLYTLSGWYQQLAQPISWVQAWMAGSIESTEDMTVMYLGSAFTSSSAFVPPILQMFALLDTFVSSYNAVGKKKPHFGQFMPPVPNRLLISV